MLIAALIIGSSLFSQDLISWETLESTRYEYSQRPDRFDFAGVPVFSKEVQALEGKKIRVKGHVIPLDVDGWSWVISAYPFSSCFFCGGAGKESVMSLDTPRKLDFSIDEVKEFVGILRLHRDPDGLTYELEKAKLLK